MALRLSQYIYLSNRKISQKKTFSFPRFHEFFFDFYSLVFYHLIVSVCIKKNFSELRLKKSERVDMLVHELIQRGQEQDLSIVDGKRRFTYGETSKAINACRNRLYAKGIRRGDRVAIFSRNSAEFIFAYMGVASLGAIAVPINFQLSSREIAYIIVNAGAEHLLTYQPLDLDGALSALDYDKELRQHRIQGIGNPDDNLPDAPGLPANFDDMQPCVIIYTSGTTGSPKGAVLSHRNLVSNAHQMRFMTCEKQHRVLCVLPMYHCFGWTCSVLYPISCGAAVVILDTFTPKETIDVIRTEKVTDMYVVPSICSLLTKLAKPEDMASLRLVVSGGTTLPLKIAQDFMDKFGIPISEGYGLSEASPVVTMNPTGKAKVGSIGPLIPGVKARFVDSRGNDVPTGEPGELLVQGDNVMLGYWQLPEATAAALKNGWLHTGDVAYPDEDGYIFIVDRIKDMIISMGENIYPREVEELIYQFPGIREVAVIGVDDKLRGQAGACFYSLNENETLDLRLLKKFLQKNLALYKIPREFHELKELPRTATGKISKRQILQDYLEKKKK